MRKNRFLLTKAFVNTRTIYLGMHYPLILPPWIWLFRLRKRRGYGVHSPYAFDFITGVIYERGEYYAYEKLDRLLPWYAHTPRNLPWPFRTCCLRPQRILHLLFRLANFSEARHALFIGKKALAYEYMKTALPHAQWHREVSEAEKCELIYVGEVNESTSQENTFHFTRPRLVIIDHLHRNYPIFSALKTDVHTTLTFDLYDLGIVMQGLSLNRMDYIVNF